MILSDYIDCGVEKMKRIYNENYQNRYHNKSAKYYMSDIGEGPENIADFFNKKIINH